MLLLFCERAPMSGPPYKCAKGMGMGALLSVFAFMLTVAQCLQSAVLTAMYNKLPM